MLPRAGAESAMLVLDSRNAGESRIARARLRLQNVVKRTASIHGMASPPWRERCYLMHTFGAST